MLAPLMSRCTTPENKKRLEQRTGNKKKKKKRKEKARVREIGSDLACANIANQPKSEER